MLFEATLDLSFILQLYQLQHVVVLLDCFQLQSQSGELSVFALGDGVIIDFLNFFDHSLLHLAYPVLHRIVLVFLLLELSLPLTLDTFVLLFLNAKLFIKAENLILKQLLFVFHDIIVGLESRAFVFDHRLRLLDLLHVVMHLALEIVLEKTEKVLLDVDLLNLAVDGLQFAVDL